MGCPSQVYIGNNLVFSICTHDPDTGVLTDADAVPTYRIYKEETAVPILTGSMAKLDDADTTGFYTESIACTVANGFESGKTYTIYIQATVDSDTGGISYSFGVDTTVSYDVLNGVIEGAITLKHVMQVILGFAAGLANGGGTASLAFRNQANNKDRVSMTVDENGNRSVVTLDLD